MQGTAKWVWTQGDALPDSRISGSWHETNSLPYFTRTNTLISDMWNWLLLSVDMKHQNQQFSFISRFRSLTQLEHRKMSWHSASENPTERGSSNEHAWIITAVLYPITSGYSLCVFPPIRPFVTWASFTWCCCSHVTCPSLIGDLCWNVHGKG